MDLFEFDAGEMIQWNNDTAIAGFCQDSASVVRVFQTQSGSEYTEEKEFCDTKADSPYRTNCNISTDLVM